MNGTMDLLQDALKSAGYDIIDIDGTACPCVGFENELYFGFAFLFETTKQLLDDWQTHSSKVLERFQFQIRNAGEKSWNIYNVFLSFDEPDSSQKALLHQVEENLVGTRKIAQCVEPSPDGIRRGLLPLLRIQNPPVLEPINMDAEIRIRVSGLPKQAVDAFLDQAPTYEVYRLIGRNDET